MLRLRLTRLFQGITVLIPAYFICASSTSAADTRPTTLAVACQSQWASAFKPVVATIEGNLVGLFGFAAIPLGICAFVLLAFLYQTQHRSVLITTVVMIVVAAIAIAIWPGFVQTLLPSC